MMFEDSYKVVTTPGEGLYKEKGSKFFAEAFPVHSEFRYGGEAYLKSDSVERLDQRVCRGDKIFRRTAARSAGIDKRI